MCMQAGLLVVFALHVVFILGAVLGSKTRCQSKDKAVPVGMLVWIRVITEHAAERLSQTNTPTMHRVGWSPLGRQFRMGARGLITQLASFAVTFSVGRSTTDKPVGRH